MDDLVSAYHDFIVSAVRKYKRKYKQCSLSFEDLYQEGVLGLLATQGEPQQAICRYIEKAIHDDLRSRGFIAVLQREFAEFRKTRARLFAELHRSPTIAELAQATKLPREKVERFEHLYRISLEYE